jgi:TRAP-type C4-dicarboxylate transport system permease small subunit
MNLIKRIFDWIFAALAWLALALLVLMTVLIFADVICRYFLHFSITWADEVSLIMLVWFVFIALAIGVRKRAHISIDFLSFFLPRWAVEGVVQRIVEVLTIGFGCVLFYFGIELVKIGTYSALSSINLPTYVEYLFIPVSGVLVVYSAATDLLRSRSAEPEADYLDGIFMGR